LFEQVHLACRETTANDRMIDCSRKCFGHLKPDLGVVGIAANHLTILKANRDLIDKFGDDYREYMQRVPGTNLILGLWRWIRRASQAERD